VPDADLESLHRAAVEVVDALRSCGLTIATVEATTGGLIGHLIVSVPGSSAVFRGGVAPYSNAMKRAIGVPEDILAKYGAVSREAAEALAVAVREWAGADVGLAETGIAGPTGGTAERPAGTFWLAISVGQGPRPDPKSECFVFVGDRVANERACAARALEMLLEALSRG
jgi:PncC family amidohydrolase